MQHKRHSLSLSALVIVHVFIFSICIGNAQQYYAKLVGTIRDQDGKPVVNARCNLTETATAIRHTADTNDHGVYQLENLPPGSYRLEVTAPGFRPSVIQNIDLLVSQISRADATLKLGVATTDVSVSAEPPIMQTDSGERGTTLEAQEIEALPLQSRNVTDLIFLAPGVSVAQGSTGLNATPLGNVNGNLEFANQYTVDGGAFTNPLTSQPIEFINIDTIQEFRVETSNYSADVGTHAGGIINIATKQGTNSLHGSLYEFLQNNVLNAANYFAVGKKPPVRYNLFGGTIGGPAIRDKLFYFGSYEGVRNDSPETFLTQVPTAAERQGNFTPGTGAKNAMIYDPFNLDSSGNRLPFPNNTIPQNRLNPVTQKYLADWPTANRSGSPNFSYNGASVNNYDRYSARIDFMLNDRDSFYGRFGYQNNPAITPGPLPGFGNGGNTDLFHGLDGVVTWNHIFSRRMLNVVRFSVADGRQTETQSDFAGQNVVQQLGLPYSASLTSFDTGCPAVSFTNTSTAGTCSYDYNLDNQANTYYITDDLSYQAGSHNLKAGFLTMRYHVRGTLGRPGGGGFSFNGLYTSQINDFSGGQPFADFLLGYQGSLGYTSAALDGYFNSNAYQMYVQDDWQITPRLTLQLGLRYDMDLPPYSSNGQLTAWVDGLNTRSSQTQLFPANSKQAVAALLAPNGGNLGFPYRFTSNNWLEPPEWTNVQPRVGFAFRPLQTPNLVVRGGFGVFYDTLSTTGSQGNIGSSLPFVSSSATPPQTQTFIPPPYMLGQAPPPLTTWYTAGLLLAPNYGTDPTSSNQARVFQWNLTTQKSFGSNWAVDLAYVGNKSVHGNNTYDWNRTYMPGYTFYYGDGSTFTITDSTPLLQRSKYPQIGNGYVSVANGRVNYYGGQLQVTKRTSHGVAFSAGYTLSRAYGLEGQQTYNSTWVQDEWNQDKLNVPLKSDIPNNFFATYTWLLPGQHLAGFAGAVLGGWQTSGIIHVQSGYLMDLKANPEWEGGSGYIKPFKVCNPNLPASQRTVNRWFNTSCFVQPGPNEFGDVSATNSVREDGLRNFDTAVEKSFKVTEQQKVTFRAEFFNAFNHPYFLDPDNVVTDSTFGVITGAAPGRAIQGALKYSF